MFHTLSRSANFGKSGTFVKTKLADPSEFAREIELKQNSSAKSQMRTDLEEVS